jgi:hypothetical protein
MDQLQIILDDDWINENTKEAKLELMFYVKNSQIGYIADVTYIRTNYGSFTILSDILAFLP